MPLRTIKLPPLRESKSGFPYRAPTPRPFAADYTRGSYSR